MYIIFNWDTQLNLNQLYLTEPYSSVNPVACHNFYIYCTHLWQNIRYFRGQHKDYISQNHTNGNECAPQISPPT